MLAVTVGSTGSVSNSRMTTRYWLAGGICTKVIVPAHNASSGFPEPGASSTTVTTCLGALSQPTSLITPAMRRSTLTWNIDGCGPSGVRPPTNTRAVLGFDGSMLSTAERSGDSCTKSASTTCDNSAPGSE